MKKYAIVIALSALLGFLSGWFENDVLLILELIVIAIVPVFLVMCLLFAIVKKWRKKLRWALPVLIGAIVIFSVSFIASGFREDYNANRAEKARLKQVAQHPALIDEYIEEHRTTTAKEFSRYELVSSRDDDQFRGYKYSYTYLFEYPNNVTDTVYFVFEYENSNVKVSENFEKNPFTPTEEKLLAKLGIKFKQFEHEHYNLKLDRLAEKEEMLFNKYLHYFNEMSEVVLYTSKKVECKLKPMAVPISGFDLYYWDITNTPIPKTIEELDSFIENKELDLFIENMYINHLSCREYIPAYRKSTITLTADRTPSRFGYFYIPRVKGEDIIKAYFNGAAFSPKTYGYTTFSDALAVRLILETAMQDNNPNIIKNHVTDNIRASLQKKYDDAVRLPYRQDLKRRKL